jgi:hypothetical protein
MSAFDPKRTSQLPKPDSLESTNQRCLLQEGALKQPKANTRSSGRPQDNDTLARSHAYKLLPLIGGHEAIENLVDLVP